MLHCFGERAADAQNVAVALGVAKRIVAMLEVIDVDIGAGERDAFAPELIDVKVEPTTVAKIGERVDIGDALKQLTFLLQDGMRFLHLFANGTQLCGQCRDIDLGS